MSNKPQINKAAIKKIPIEKFLANINILPVKQDRHGYWYLSPLHQENTASFKVNPKLNTWFDFGTKQGGNIIDFVILKFDKSFYEALEFLSKGKYTKEIQRDTLPKKEGNKIKEIIGINKQVRKYMLLKYLRSRSIEPINVKGLVGEIHYKIENNPNTLYSLCFANNIGGHEVRNKHFKGSFGKKHFTTIKRGSDSITVFEGFLDFLSLESNKPIKSDVMVLNSCVNAPIAIKSLKEYSKIYLMLDNDRVGDSTTKMISDYIESTKDLRYLYKNHKDVNDWIIDCNKQK